MADVDDRDGVLARLPAHLEDDARHAVEPCHRALLGGPVLGPAHVAHPDGRAVDGGDHHVLEGAGVGDAPERAERGLAQARGDVAAGHVGVLADERVAHRRDRQLVGGEPVRLDPDIDRAVEAADQPHLADAVGALELDLDDLVGELGQLAQREVAGHRHGEDGRLVVVELRDDRRLGVARQVLDREGDLLADVLGGDVDVPPEVEVDDDDGLARPGDRPQLADALDGVDDLLDLAR